MSKIVVKAGATVAAWLMAGAAMAQPMDLASLNSPLASPMGGAFGSPLSSPMGMQAGAAALTGQRPGLLSGVVGCQASGYKQGVGAVAGAAAGGLVGNKLLKKNKLAGTLGGGLAGGAAGSFIGCKLQQNDQARRDAAARANAEADDPSGQGDRGGAYAANDRFAGAPGRDGFALGGRAAGLDGLRFAPRVTPASDYDTAPAGRYVASTVTNLRAAPSTSADVLARIDPDQQVRVLAAVAGTPWMMVGVDGRADGYAYAPNLRAAGALAEAGACRPVRQTSSARAGAAPPETFDACPQADGGWALRRRAG